jgi:periplasmic protein TonB
MANPASRKKKRYAPRIIVGAIAVTLCVGLVLFVRNTLSGGAPPVKKVVQEIQVIRPPPPPPDTPPPPPPPPQEKVEVPDPQEKPDPTPSKDPPAGEKLGLDAEGTAGADAFGLLGNKGGRELVGTGGSAFAWYAGLLKNQILDALDSEKKARTGGYSVVVRVWVRDDGSIEKVNIVQSSGDRERDQVIEGALSRMGRLSQAPPADMPEPISLKIVSRG